MSKQTSLFKPVSGRMELLSIEAVLLAHREPKSKPKEVIQEELLLPKKKCKYGNKWVVIDGINFQSTGEGNYWLFLKSRLQQGFIKSLKRQVKFHFEINGVTITSYTCDFVVENHDGSIEVIDYKSAMTITLPEFQIKKAMMLALYGVDVKCVGSSLSSGNKKKFQKSSKKVSKYGR